MPRPASSPSTRRRALHRIQGAIRCVLVGHAILLPIRSGASAAPPTPEFTHFEARITHPLETTPEGRTLLAIQPLSSRLSVFLIAGEAADRPVLTHEIPVGLEPVSVRLRHPAEAWVINEVSDSVSVVSLDRHTVVATLPCADEPADVAFAGDRAYVSCARSRMLEVYDAAGHQRLASIPLDGLQPRALAVHPSGLSVVVAFLQSGNGTTILPAPTSASPAGGAPLTASIVPASDPRVPFSVLDHDLAVVSVAGDSLPATTIPAVRYLDGIGTSLFTIAFRPGTEEAWVGNTEARNLESLEPRLKNRFIENRITRVDTATGARRNVDLTPFDESGRSTLEGGPAAALAQPMAIAFHPAGSSAWVAAFASDRVARLDAATGIVLERIDLRPSQDSNAPMRGPRGLAWSPERERLYVFNKVSDTLSTVDTRNLRVLSEVPVGGADPLSPSLRAGRGLLYDARLSGNGASSCGSCHIDADLDGLAWDLGDPDGPTTVVIGANLAVHDPTPRERLMHPLKGPMVTQTLRGMDPGRRLHWRGDRATLRDFNVTFRDLLGGTLQPEAQVDRLAAYLATLRHHPNPHRGPDDSLPVSLRGGNARQGEKLFAAHIHHCGVCHVLPAGSDHNIDDPRNLHLTQPILTPSLHTTYQRAVLDTRPGATNLAGFGMLHDGTGGSASLPTVHFYDLDALSGTQFLDVAAFVLSFDSGTSATVGRWTTLASTGAASPDLIPILLTRAAAPGACDLVLSGSMRGQPAQFLYDPSTQRFLAGDRDWTPSLDEVLAQLQPNDTLTVLAVPPGSGAPTARDRDHDGQPDSAVGLPRLAWRRVDGELVIDALPTPAGWVLETSPAMSGAWSPYPGVPPIRIPLGIPDPAGAPPPHTLFRWRRTW